VRQSKLPSWQYWNDANGWLAILGFAYVVACLALIGPIAMKDAVSATLVSAGLIIAFFATGIPLLYIACLAFASCI
jgi:hypothetical protein